MFKNLIISIIIALSFSAIIQAAELTYPPNMYQIINVIKTTSEVVVKGLKPSDNALSDYKAQGYRKGDNNTYTEYQWTEDENELVKILTDKNKWNVLNIINDDNKNTPRISLEYGYGMVYSATLVYNPRKNEKIMNAKERMSTYYSEIKESLNKNGYSTTLGLGAYKKDNIKISLQFDLDYNLYIFIENIDLINKRVQIDNENQKKINLTMEEKNNTIKNDYKSTILPFLENK